MKKREYLNNRLTLLEFFFSWADTLAVKNEQAKCSENELNGSGECLAVIKENKWDENTVLKMWFKEMEKFDPNTMHPNENAGR